MKKYKVLRWDGVKIAVGDSRRCPNFWRIYADFQDKTVWCHNYISSNEWSDYSKYDGTIKQVACGNGYNSIFGQTKITMKELDKILKQYEKDIL